jgi:tetratricopeptide (TPR) repeat protein
MIQMRYILAVAAISFASVSPLTLADEGTEFREALAALKHEFDVASFSELKKGERRDAFEALVEHAAEFSSRHPGRVEAVAWNGIVLSTYAGEVSALGAMKYAKAAREALHEAEAMMPSALDGGIYASLGSLYSKVPGGIVGFGDDDLALEYFEKALEVDASNIDNNYFFAEFLIEQKQYDRAATLLRRALDAPTVAARPLFDFGRREQIRQLLDIATSHIQS